MEWNENEVAAWKKPAAENGEKRYGGAFSDAAEAACSGSRGSVCERERWSNSVVR